MQRILLKPRKAQRVCWGDRHCFSTRRPRKRRSPRAWRRSRRGRLWTISRSAGQVEEQQDGKTSRRC